MAVVSEGKTSSSSCTSEVTNFACLLGEAVPPQVLLQAASTPNQELVSSST